MRLVETPSSTFHNTCQYSNVVLLTTKSRPKKSVEVKLFTVAFFWGKKNVNSLFNVSYKKLKKG